MTESVTSEGIVAQNGYTKVRRAYYMYLMVPII
jgi:hypothetical protein